LAGGYLPSPLPPTVPLEDNGIPVEDAMSQMQLELQVVQSRLICELSSISGQVFESYKDTLEWVVANCSPEDWQYVIGMPTLYSLVRPDRHIHDTLLEEASNSSRAGYASSRVLSKSRVSANQESVVSEILTFFRFCPWTPF
jgi:hypothetical protein